MRACSWATVARATAGPPQTRRTSACTMRVRLPPSRARIATRLLSSFRCSLSVRYSGCGRVARLGGRSRRSRRAGLPRLARACSRSRHLLGFEQAGDADEVQLLLAAGLGERAELVAVEEHPVEGRARPERLPLELVERAPRRCPRACSAAPAGRRRAAGRRRLAVERVVALPLELGRERQQERHARQEDRRDLAAPAGAHEAADRPARRTAASTRSWRRRRPRAAARRRPPTPCAPRPSSAASPSEKASMRSLDAGSSREHDGGLLPGELGEDLRVRPAPCAWSVAITRPPASGTVCRTSLSRRSARREHRRDPVAAGVEGGAPGLRGDVLGVVLAERRPPSRRPARVRQRIVPA